MDNQEINYQEMTICIDDDVYKSYPDSEGLCVDCAFKFDLYKCQLSNSIIPCSDSNRTESEIVWKPYSKLNKPVQEPKQAIEKSSNLSLKDNIVSEIRELLLQRSETGIKKYSTTLDRKDLKPSEWCQHLLEELLDASGYVLRLKKDLESIEKITAGSKE